MTIISQNVIAKRCTGTSCSDIYISVCYSELHQQLIIRITILVKTHVTKLQPQLNTWKDGKLSCVSFAQHLFSSSCRRLIGSMMVYAVRKLQWKGFHLATRLTPMNTLRSKTTPPGSWTCRWQGPHKIRGISFMFFQINSLHRHMRPHKMISKLIVLVCRKKQKKQKLPVSKDGTTTNNKAKGKIQIYSFQKSQIFQERNRKRGENQYINSMYLRVIFSLQHKHQQREELNWNIHQKTISISMPYQ